MRLHLLHSRLKIIKTIFVVRGFYSGYLDHESFALDLALICFDRFESFYSYHYSFDYLDFDFRFDLAFYSP